MAVYRIMGLAAAALAGGYFYRFINRTMKYYRVDVERKRFKAGNVIFSAFLASLCRNIWSTSTMLILHFLVISIFLDLVTWIIRKLCRNKNFEKSKSLYGKLYGCGFLPIVLTALIMLYGHWNMSYAMKTEYNLEADKNVGSYKVILITDTHYATIQDTDILKTKIEEINGENPDIVVLGGDMVDEGTTKEKMREVFQVFGELDAKYGIYYVYGNHDRQPYTQSRSYTDEELNDAILESGITILEDNYIEIGSDLVVAGRGDAARGSVSGRASVEEILQGADREKYIIMVDHQPLEAEENDAQGVDLELSGHTHAGQIWPVGYLSELAGVLNYGFYQKGNCKVIVSSGFTGWGYSVRTEGHCEYVVINVNSFRKD